MVIIRCLYNESTREEEKLTEIEKQIDVINLDLPSSANQASSISESDNKKESEAIEKTKSGKRGKIKRSERFLWSFESLEEKDVDISFISVV